MNKILNGDFSSGFDYWSNGAGGGRAYTRVSGKATAISDPDSTAEWTYKMRQTFSSNDEILAATISVWYEWAVLTGNLGDGQARFIVDLVKPDSSSVNLADVTKTPGSGSGDLLDGVDIKSHMTQQGNYKLWLTAKVKSAVHEIIIGEEPVVFYYQSTGRYDNISIDVAIKKYKTVHEKIGGSGTLNDEAKVSRSEIVGLSEAYSTEVRPCQFETASGIVGLSELLSAQITRKPSVLESAGLLERLQATRTQGNIITTYDISDLTDWNETDGVTTPWIKEKTEIN